LGSKDTWPSVAKLEGDSEASYILSQGQVDYVRLGRLGDGKDIRLGPQEVRIPKDWQSPVDGDALAYADTGIGPRARVIFERVKPGSYMLDSYYSSWTQVFCGESSLEVPLNLTFDVPPGKVVYIGTLAFDGWGTGSSTGGSVRVNVKLIDNLEAVLELLDIARPGLGKATAPRVIRADYLRPSTLTLAVPPGATPPVSDIDWQAFADALRVGTESGNPEDKYKITFEMKDGKLVVKRIEPPKTAPTFVPETSTQQAGPAADLQIPPPAAANLGNVWTSPTDGKEMVYVPAGEFLMGSPGGKGDDDEHPQRSVYLDAFWIDKTEVTVAEYRKFCQATGRAMASAPSREWQDDHPVVNVSWYDAVAYAVWAEKRLPTEAEWEKAARGTDGRQYPWGNTWDSGKCANVANSSGGPRPLGPNVWSLHSAEKNPSGGPQPVGSYPSGASPYGALDMAGNVWEWCVDWYGADYYRVAPARNPTGPASGTYWVLRGGSWCYGVPTYFRCAYRLDSCHPDDRYYLNGFRCVRGPL